MGLTQSILRGKHVYPDTLAMSFASRETTYGQLHDKVALCAGAFAELDPEVKGTVGILSMNSDYAIVSFYGACWAGKVPNYLNIRWSAHELHASIDDFAPSILTVDDAFLEMGLSLLQLCDSIEHLVYLGDSVDLPEGVLSLSDLMANVVPIENRCGSGDDMAFLNYTGGTTGKGKGVIHTHASHMAGMNMTIAEGLFPFGKSLVAMPFFHIGGLGLSNACLMSGSTMYILEAFDPLSVLRTVQDNKIENVLLVPTMMQMVLRHPAFAEYNWSSVKNMRYGASPIDESLLMELKEAFPAANFMQVYGQTEGVPATILHNNDHNQAAVDSGRIRSAGRAALGCDIEIRDAEGNSLPVGEIGEVALRGPHIMKGYLNMPEQTAKALQGGWLITGDAGYLSSEGYLHVVDRIKDMIITGGENVYSAEVEATMCLHSAVEQCAVVGLPDEKWGERVHADVILKPGMSATAEELTAHCRESLAGFKLPRSVTLVDEIPLTAVNKVDKVAIRARYTG
ncbi:MAG: acyl-CoA synthetase (AMP-forming)/AMP-acid ligase II [Halieaceae bacterium]|jgi:acyl-CoA synthetase (AMP-forming)/AMP-acid ligase II